MIANGEVKIAVDTEEVEDFAVGKTDEAASFLQKFFIESASL